MSDHIALLKEAIDKWGVDLKSATGVREALDRIFGEGRAEEATQILMREGEALRMLPLIMLVASGTPGPKILELLTDAALVSGLFYGYEFARLQAARGLSDLTAE